MSKAKKPNVSTISQFAKLKQTTRANVHNWVKAGYINTTEIGGIFFIDLDLYGDFDPGTIQKGRPLEKTGLQIKLRKLEKENAALKEQLVGKK